MGKHNMLILGGSLSTLIIPFQENFLMYIFFVFPNCYFQLIKVQLPLYNIVCL